MLYKDTLAVKMWLIKNSVVKICSAIYYILYYSAKLWWGKTLVKLHNFKALERQTLANLQYLTYFIMENFGKSVLQSLLKLVS